MSKKIFSYMNQEFKPNLYGLENFEPTIIDQDYLDALHVSVRADSETLNKLVKGSKDFIDRYRDRSLIDKAYYEKEIDINEPMEIHNYTGQCPTNTFEVNPIKTGCHVGCLYCLVNDGKHYQDAYIFSNYDKYLRNHLSEQGKSNVFYYFSPKSEAFQEPTLETGIAHKILKEFIKHYKENPSSKVRLFIASKAGTKQLLYRHDGVSILDLLEELRGKVQFNISIGILPDTLHNILEPNAASVNERLDASLLCQKRGITSNSVLTQPIIGPFLSDEVVNQYFEKMALNNIANFKPEFLTVCMENLAMLAQLVGLHSKQMEKELLELYISPYNKEHVKQRERTAPDRMWSYNTIKWLVKEARKYGISTSICYWVRNQLNIDEELIPIINNNGFLCLGYQTKLFVD